MAAPNIVEVTVIKGRTEGQAVGLSATAIVANPAASGKVFKVNALYVGNVDGTNNAEVDVIFYDASVTTSFHIAKTLTVPADASISVLNRSMYLEEGDELRLLANATGDVEAVASFEEIN